MACSLVNHKETDMSSVIILHRITPSGLCAWFTDDCRDEMAGISPRAAKVVQIFKDYSKVMEKAGVPYRYS